jgi:hypothetical protein
MVGWLGQPDALSPEAVRDGSSDVSGVVGEVAVAVVDVGVDTLAGVVPELAGVERVSGSSAARGEGGTAAERLEGVARPAVAAWPVGLPSVASFPLADATECVMRASARLPDVTISKTGSARPPAKSLHVPTVSS